MTNPGSFRYHALNGITTLGALLAFVAIMMAITPFIKKEPPPAPPKQKTVIDVHKKTLDTLRRLSKERNETVPQIVTDAVQLYSQKLEADKQ